MKLDIKTMLVTLGVCMLFAFTATDIMTIKPAIPKSVITLTKVPSNELNTYISSYTKQGYIVKTCDAGYGYGCLLIMEKY